MDQLTDTQDALLTMPLQDAAQRLRELAEPAAVLHALFGRVEGGRDVAAVARLASLSAGLLSGRQAASRLPSLLPGLMAALRFLLGREIPEPEHAALCSALAEVDRLLQVAHDDGEPFASPAQLMALTRARAHLEAESGNAQGALSLFARATTQARTADPGAQITAHVELGMALWRWSSHEAAVEHLSHAAEIAADSDAIDAYGKQATAQALIEVASDLHYQQRAYPLSIRLARHATELSPDSVPAHLVLGNGLAMTGQYEAAVPVFRRLIELDPEDRSSARNNLSAALVELRRYDEAIELASEALRLRPRQVRPLSTRAQLRAQSGDTEGAIADFELLLDLLEEDKPPPGADGTVQQDRYREHWKLWFIAYHKLVELHRQRGARDAVEALCVRMRATGDDALIAMGHRISGDAAREAGRVEQARRHYDAALAEFEHDHLARESRASLAHETGDMEGAISDLSVLASRHAAPKRAIEVLTAMAQAHPDEPAIAKWLGFAHFEVGDFEDCERSLDRYLGRRPDDVQARRWLGLSLTSAFPQQINERTGERLDRGLEELAHASADGDAEARLALLWTLDRVLLQLEYRHFLVGSHKPRLAALPGLEALLGAIDDALADGPYGQRLAASARAVALASELGLPCLAAYLHVLNAEVALLAGKLQLAGREARFCEALMPLVARPRTPELQRQAPDAFERHPDQVVLEPEHVYVYARTNEANTIASLVAARVFAASGDRQAADRALGELAPLLERAGKIPATEACVLAQTLRDAGRGEDALQVLERAEQRLEERPELADDSARARLSMTRATVLAVLGRLPEAISPLMESQTLLREGERWVAALNLAQALIVADMHEDALTVLDQFDIEDAARSDRDRFAYHLSRALALHGCGRADEAQQASDRSLSALESFRSQLVELDLRRSWAGQQVRVYGELTRIALGDGRPARAFEIAELGRSRLLVDEIALGGSVANGDGRQLERDLRGAQEQRELLSELSQADASDRRVETLARLHQSTPDLDLYADHAMGELSSEKLERACRRAAVRVDELRREVDQHRLRSAEQLFGKVLSYGQCRQMLRAAGDAVLVEIVATDAQVFALLIVPERDAPIVCPILQGVDVATWTSDLVGLLLHADDASARRHQRPLDALLEAIAGDVPRGTTLCIVPHGPLHGLPFHALWLGEQRLIERNPIAYAPSASVLAPILTGEPFQGEGDIVVGNTRGDLPHADQEALAVASLLGAKPLPRRAATRDNLRQLLAGAKGLRVLHLACHGYFDAGDALASGLMASDDSEAGVPRILTARDLLERRVHAELVALSACESGKSDVSPGEELLGLNRALLAGGTRSVLSSLWKVEDGSTSVLMQDFYGGWLREGLPKAQALQAAQCRLMKLTRAELHAATRSLPGYRDLSPESAPTGADAASPAHWAAFCLNGDWR